MALRKLGSRGSYRRARHVLAFAATPIALALFVYWPFRIAVYGTDLFRTGGPDGRGAGDVTGWIFYGFVVWALVLLVIGVRAVHGWTWARALTATGIAVVAPVAAGLLLASL